MNQLTPFKFENKTIGVVTDDAGCPWFSANEICEVLGFGNPRQALNSHVDAEDVQKLDTLTQGGRQFVTHINESGMYALIFGSTKPEAKRFKRWVTSEVLPSIRKTGSYAVPRGLGSKRAQKFSQQHSLPSLSRHQMRAVNQKATSMGRELAEACRDYLLWELAGSAQSGEGYGPVYVDDNDLQALMYYASVDNAAAFAQARSMARTRLYFAALRA